MHNLTEFLWHNLELKPSAVAESFYNGEIEAEFRRVGQLEYSFKLDADRHADARNKEEGVCVSTHKLYRWLQAKR